MTPLQSFGLLPASPHRVVEAATPDRLSQQLVSLGGFTPRGMGRSYGDAALNPNGIVLNTRSLNRFCGFDSGTGTVEVEAGVTLGELARVARRRGWRLPVVPGTSTVTVGGAIAADVHGKNHHRRGSFGHHVAALELVRSDGSVTWCSLNQSSDLFHATIGGFGMTGVIVRARLQLIPGACWTVEARNIPFRTLEEYFDLAAEHRRVEYTVAWLDCVSSAAGRGVFELGSPCFDDIELSSPDPSRVWFVSPVSLVRPTTVAAFNACYYALNSRRVRPRRVSADQFLHPLDAVQDWNRLYGKRGFYQYQCVIPPSRQREAVAELLHVVAASGQASMLAVLKTFGALPPVGVMSFPRAGTTLALDFPNRGSETLELFDRLDRIVVAAHGAVYAAKDARMPGELFRLGYPHWREAWQFRDPAVTSSLFRRVFHDVD